MKLNISNISKRYETNLALDKFTAELTPGIYALLGPNGSGKSTLMNIMTDNLKADSGEITYTNDDNIAENVLDMGVRFREKIGFMPQYPGLYPNFTVERFMQYMAVLKGIPKAQAKSEINSILMSVELQDVLKRKISSLSGGMKQRLALAQAVLGAPEILILDEPTAGLDPKQRISIRNFISKIALDKIVIIATHVVSDVEFIAKNIIMLKKGVIIENTSPGELIQKIRGMVWEISVSEDKIVELQDNFRVTNIHRRDDSNEIVLRILTNDSSIPINTAVPVEPTLEDYYLHVFADIIVEEIK